ncbi:unnamed protein product [Agarophyton chilense]|eukprot:gb/GEZJ01005723.1/.p1 GENE.gb/GEZJ01005723.1/~~gb/GEZJ01005723.1/.p1  ORF type:complete len:1556 (-),score=174.37 gb/GEZJ01005723.1/:109-4776(-)
MPQLFFLLLGFLGLLDLKMLNARPIPEFDVYFSSSQALFCSIYTRDSERVLLQSNGNVDDVAEFLVCPSQPRKTYLYVTTSSSPDVLPIDSEHVTLNVIQSDVSTCLNVSILLVFDKLVGVTTFTLSLTDPETSFSVCDSSISFTIAGLSFFETSPASVGRQSNVTAPEDSKIVYSGDDNLILSDYRDVLEKRSRSLQFLVQYPDGSSSSSMPVSDLISSLETILVFSESDASSPIQLDPKCSNIAPTSDLSVNCGAGFAVKNGGEFLSYDLRYAPYKDGTTKMIFLWPFFTENAEALFGDQYENSLLISVMGDPPPILESVEPRRSFWRSGGETVTITYDNVNASRERRLQVGNFVFKEVQGTYRLLENGLYSAEYMSAPGSGVNLDIKLEISLQDGSAVESVLVNEDIRFSYRTTPLSVDDIDPPLAVAGDTVTISGYFDGFDPSNQDHKLLIGTKPLSSLGIIPELSDDRRSITFQLPERHQIGTAYNFPISFSINSENSTPVDFSFESDTPLVVYIRVLGASYDWEKDQYELGSCDPSEYIAELPNGIFDPEVFEWRMVAVDSSEDNILGERKDVINASTKELRIPPTVFGGRTGAFIISVKCEINEETLTNSVVVVKTRGPVIGVTLVAPSIRGIAFPNVAARVYAQIVTPPANCYNSLSTVVYEWNFQDKTYVKENITSSMSQGVEAPVVGLLGREFVIPQSALSYGNQTVSLVAYIYDDPGINGNSVTRFEVKPLGLVSVIGYGASFLVHDGNANLRITSENTICPDCVVLGRQAISTYRWTCRMSATLKKLGDDSLCSLRFLPNPEAKSFSVSSQALLRQRDLNARDPGSEQSKSFFLRYTLQVGTDSFLSAEVIQTIEVAIEEAGVATLMGIDFYDNRGKSLHWQSLPFYEDLLIVPRSTDSVSWTIEMISSSLRTNVLSDPNKLISLDRYYNPSLNRPQQHPLGIKAAALLPYELYFIRLNLSSRDPSVETSRVTFTVRTRDRPKLVLPALFLESGSTDYVFSAWAGVNLDISYPFLFYFFAVDENGREQCLDGCSGSKTIQFRIPVTGKFQIMVRLRDARGSVVLDEAYFPGALIVSESPKTFSAISNFSTAAQFIADLERAGDHGTIVLLATMISSVQSSRVSQSLTAIDRTNFKNIVDILEEVVRYSIPSTSSSKSFILAALRLSSVQPEYISLTTLSSLLSIVDLSIKRAPAEEFFDHEVELKVFYNLSLEHALRLSSRVGKQGAVQHPKDNRNGIRTVVPEVFHLLKEHLTIVLSRDAHCGAIKRFNTILFQDAPTIAVLGNQTVFAQVLRQITGSYDFLDTYTIPRKPRHASFSMAVTCFLNETDDLHGETASFNWCGESFSLGNRNLATDFQFTSKLLFSLMETIDYRFLTGSVDRESDTMFITNTSITSLSPRGIDENFLPSIPNCFRVNMSVYPLGLTPYRGCLSADGYSIRSPTISSLDQKSLVLVRNFSDVETYLSDDQSSTILVLSQSTGMFGAAGVDCPANARRPQVQTPVFNIEFGYLAFGGAMVGVAGVAVSWVTSSSSYAGLVATAAAA